MSIDDVAMLAAKVARGERTSHPLAYQAMGMACESIRRMVYKLSLKYAVSSRIDPDDLAQECMKRIVQRVGDFDVKLARFTTWSWTVCQSVLNGAYRKQLGWNEHIVGIDQADLKGVVEPRTEPDVNSLLRTDIMATLSALISQYPGRKRLILGLFGNPDKKGFVMPSGVMVSEAAKSTGIGRRTVMAFYRDVVQPFFLQRFSTHPGDPAATPELPEKRPGGMKVVDAALQVLTEAKRAMTARELYSAAVGKGLYVSNAGDPYVSFFSVLGKALKKGEARLVRSGPAMWGVAT
jgi:RNA polymerase sigma factor (sigma-70 family)